MDNKHCVLCKLTILNLGIKKSGFRKIPELEWPDFWSHCVCCHLINNRHSSKPFPIFKLPSRLVPLLFVKNSKTGLLCISTSKRMLAHAFTWLKTMKYIWKSWKKWFFIMRTRGSCKAHEEKWGKKFVGQQLGVTPKSWLAPKSWLLIWIFKSLQISSKNKSWKF